MIQLVGELVRIIVDKDGFVTAMTWDAFHPTTRPRSFMKRRINVDIRMPALEVLPEPIGSTPFEITAIHTKAGFVGFPQMSSQARWP